MCFGSDSPKRGHSRRSGSGSGGESSRPRLRKDDGRSRRYAYEHPPRPGENPDGHDRRLSRRDYPHGRSSQSREYPSRHDPQKRSSRSRESYDPHHNGHHSTYRRDASDHRRDDIFTGASRAPRDTRPSRDRRPPGYQARPTGRQRFQSTEPRVPDRRPPSYERTRPPEDRGSRNGAWRYDDSHARPTQPPLPQSRQRTRAQVPPGLRRRSGLPSDLKTHIGAQQVGEEGLQIGYTAYSDTKLGFRPDNPISVPADLSAVTSALEALHTSPNVTATASCAEDSETPAPKSWFDELTQGEKQTAYNVLQRDVERVLRRKRYPYLKSLFMKHASEGNWFNGLPPGEQASMAQYKFKDKEAFSQRMATDYLGSIEDWVKVLPEITFSDFRAAWFIKSRAATLLSGSQVTEAAEREAFHKKALEMTEKEVRGAITLILKDLATVPIGNDESAREWVATEGLRRTYGPSNLAPRRLRHSQV